jgi:uncharacterized protein (TIGR03437 family)
VPAWAQQQRSLTDKAAAFFDDSTVKEVRLYFEDSNWYNTMVQNHQNQRTNGDPYLPCRLKYGTVDLPKIGCRFKGNSSFQRNGIKRPFKLDFNEFVPGTDFLGLSKLNLQTNDLSPDFMREKLFADFMGKFIPSLRMVHVKLYVNDAYYGLYIAMEQPDKNMMESRYGRNEDGNMWEGNEVLGGGIPGGQPPARPDLTWRGSDPATYRSIYELETNVEANDYSQLIQFLDVLNNTPVAELPAKFEAIADVEELLTYIALNHLFVNLDSYVNDAGEYYLYDRTRDGKFIAIAWDHNESFGTTGDGTPRITNPWTMDLFWLPANATTTNQRPLAQKLWDVPAYRRHYLRIMAKLLREGFNTETFGPRITQLANLIRADVIADPNKVTTNAQFETNLNEQVTSAGGGFGGGLPILGLNQFIRERYNFVRPLLNQQALPSDVQLNELVAVNNGTYKDANGDADPWVEIYNQGPGPVAIGNFYLTDDAANPTKFKLPTKTLADGEYLIVWLDNETSEGDTHANFTPLTAGGKLFLFNGSTQLDAVTYPMLASGVSHARQGFYGNVWGNNFQPTAGLANAATASSATAPTQGTGQLLVNEIMADNEDTYPDPQEAGVYEDWIEIFNPGTTTVNMSGMYLTDNLNNKTKWKIPDGVTIPARGYLVFIADNEPAQGNLHTSWQLSGEGEAVGLFAADGTTLIDSYTFGIQQGDVSVGRATDGDSSWSIFQPATPGAANTAAYVPWVTNAANYLMTVAPNGISALFGTTITSSTNVASTTPLPTTLGGASVTITDKNNITRDAPLFFTSAGQVNFLVPAATATGRARLTLKKQDGTTTSGDLLVKSVAPGLFAANANGAGIAAALALRVDATGKQTYLPLSQFDAATQRFVPVPLSLGAATDQTFLILFGTGWRGRTALADVVVEVGGSAVPVAFAGAQGDLVGLDQLNVGPLPRTLAGRNSVNVDLRVDSKRSNRVTVSIQ